MPIETAATSDRVPFPFRPSPVAPRRVARALAPFLALLAPLAAHADGMVDTVTVLPPVIVKGERALVPERTTATSVRLNRGSVTKFLPATASDALIAVPGVDLVKLGPWASRVSFRGLSGDRVLVLVDGVRVNTVRGHGAQASLVSLDRLDEVELLPGASSAQFGSDAMGGVINLVTHGSLLSNEPRLSAMVSARGSAPGDGWEQSARARLMMPSFGLELTGGLGGLTSLHTPDGAIPNSGDREEDYSARVAARAGSALFDFEHTHHAARDVGLPAFSNASGATGSYPLQQRDAQRLEMHLPGSGILSAAQLLAFHQSFRTHFDETTVDSTFLRGRFIATTTHATADRVASPAWSIGPQLRFKGPGALRLSGEYRREETGGPRSSRETVRYATGALASDTTTTGESIPPARRDAWSVAAFAGQTLHSLRIEGGTRFDALRSQADSATNSSTATLDVTDRRWSAEMGVARPIGSIEPYLHGASGFRAPNLQERYFNDEIHGGMRLFGNPDLRPERSLSYEVGVRASDAWGGVLRGTRLSVYRSDVDDLISLKYMGQLYLVPRFQYVNIERARIEGIELTSELRLGGVGLTLSAGMPRGVDRNTGEKLLDAGTPRATLDLTLPLPGPLPYARLATRVRWNDAVAGVDSSFARPAFTTGSIELSSVFSGFRAVLAVHNLWNVRYREPLSFIPEPGRTFAISFRHDFDLPLSNPGITP
ncbi:MAG: hypothetical protein A2W00_00950 [Candidatus Eisenbacteria bacterium RBG_16_71_46]|nr:MAG: hypothetical protein A2W00_00950 [Candidatus Eisenbacteria bacterium RBG_16_71_46]